MTRLPGRLVLLGHPVSHSLSPRFQNAALAAADIPLRYDAWDVEPERLDDALAAIRRERAAGNVTVPHKERVHDACDALSALARRVGAVNTFVVDDDGRLVGDNTDVGGFDVAARSVLGAAPQGLRVGVLGAGGAAAAVLAAVEQWTGCSAFVHNRSGDRARALCARFRSVAQCIDDAADAARCDLLVNATSIGLRTGDFPISVSLVAPETCVVDLVYRAGETAFVLALRSRGIRATDGLPMLIEQGALAFEGWFGSAGASATGAALRAVMWESVLRHDPARAAAQT